MAYGDPGTGYQGGGGKDKVAQKPMRPAPPSVKRTGPPTRTSAPAPTAPPNAKAHPGNRRAAEARRQTGGPPPIGGPNIGPSAPPPASSMRRAMGNIASRGVR